MNIETTRCVCDECGELAPDAIVLITSDEKCTLQLCNPCARRVILLLVRNLKEETK